MAVIAHVVLRGVDRASYDAVAPEVTFSPAHEVFCPAARTITAS